MTKRYLFLLVLTLPLLQLIIGCNDSSSKTRQNDVNIDLVPEELSQAPNYWCTWYWQNYSINGGQPVTNISPSEVYSNLAAREEMTEEALLGQNGWANIMLPESRGEYYFLIDHGWQDKSIEENTFFTLVMDPNDFPSYADLDPKDRIKRLNEDLQNLGWRGLGLWVRGNIDQDKARKLVEWSRYAGVEYWKIDGGDTNEFNAQKMVNEIYPNLYLEYATGAGGALNSQWQNEDAVHYSTYSPKTKNIDFPNNTQHALEVIQNVDIFRTYDAVPLLVSTVTLQRIHDVLLQTVGNREYSALLNIQDDPNIAAALGMVVGLKRHPLNNPRMYKGRDMHFQITGDRKMQNRFNEMDRFIRWQRIAPPMPAGYGTYKASNKRNYDQFEFRPGDTWMEETWNKMVTQSAPKILARNIELPEVHSTNGEDPYVMAGRFPNGVIAIATEGRVKPEDSWYHPKSEIHLKIDDGKEPIGVFGYYQRLVLELDETPDNEVKLYAQDLLADQAIEITEEVSFEENRIIIPGELIDQIGTSENDPGDISAPGLVLQIEFSNR